MQKIITLVFLILVYMSIDSTDTQTVFSDKQNSDTYMTYYILIDNLSTNNFNDYLNNINVVSVYPSINSIYKKRIEEFYIFENIDKFKKYYIEALRQKGYFIEANKYIISPIRIDKVLVYSTINKINEVLNSKNVKYTIYKSNSYVK